MKQETDQENNADEIRQAEDYYRSVSRMVHYRKGESLTRELLKHLVDTDRNLLMEEKKKADLLLETILPPYMIEELKRNGRVKPEHYDNVTVLYTDFTDFSATSRYMGPGELLKELTIYFDFFEAICDRFKLDKVKTIGDAFLAVGGLRGDSRTTPIDAVLAASEMIQFTQERKKEKLKFDHEEFWGIRASIHSGPITAGVVGRRKISFDVWGHTVNTVARIDNAGKEGSLTVSLPVFDRIRDYFDCEFIGEYDLTGVGSQHLYRVLGLRDRLFQGDSRWTPGKNFKRLYNYIRKGYHVVRINDRYQITRRKLIKSEKPSDARPISPVETARLK